MLWAQIAILVLLGIGLLLNANQHGKEGKKVNFWTSLVSACLAFVLMLLAGAFDRIF